MGHRHGNSKYLDDAVEKLDDQVKRIWNAIQYREKNFNEEWLIYITTDHGREDNGYHHGGQSLRERRTWISTNANGLNARFKKQQPAVVDIIPSIASFLKIDIPKEQLREIDGVSLSSKLSATDARASFQNEKIFVQWKAMERKGTAKIWLATTNNFKTGGRDDYKLITEVPVAKGSAILDVKNMPSDFYKIVIEMPYNYLNTWTVIK